MMTTARHRSLFAVLVACLGAGACVSESEPETSSSFEIRGQGDTLEGSFIRDDHRIFFEAMRTADGELVARFADENGWSLREAVGDIVPEGWVTGVTPSTVELDHHAATDELLGEVALALAEANVPAEALESRDLLVGLAELEVTTLTNSADLVPRAVTQVAFPYKCKKKKSTEVGWLGAKNVSTHGISLNVGKVASNGTTYADYWVDAGALRVIVLLAKPSLVSATISSAELGSFIFTTPANYCR